MKKNYVFIVLMVLMTFIMIACKKEDYYLSQDNILLYKSEETVLSLNGIELITNITCDKETSEIIEYSYEKSKEDETVITGINVKAIKTGYDKLIFRVNSYYDITLEVYVVLDTIEEPDKLLSYQEDDYYIYFYRDGCKYCEYTIGSVLTYMYKNEYENSGTLKVYACDLTLGTPFSSINRSYTGEGGQGDGSNFVDGVTVWSDLYLSGTPKLIRVSKGVAYYEASGYKQIPEKLK